MSFIISSDDPVKSQFLQKTPPLGISCLWVLILNSSSAVDVTAAIYSCKAFASAAGWDSEPHEFHITHGGAVAGHLSAIKVSFRAAVMWNYAPLCSQSFTLASQARMPSNLLEFL